MKTTIEDKIALSRAALERAEGPGPTVMNVAWSINALVVACRHLVELVEEQQAEIERWRAGANEEHPKTTQ